MTGGRDRFRWDRVDAGGVGIHYGEAGQGDPVICLHGTGPGASAWSNFNRNAPALADRFRVLLPDFPRFGGSDVVDVDSPRLTFLSGVIRDFMDAMGLQSAHLVGNSMGAQTAMKLAIDTPERVRRLVLLAPAAVGYSLFTPMPTEGVRLIAGYYKGEGPTSEKMRRLLETMAYDPAFVTDELVQERYEVSVRPEVVAAHRGAHWARQSLEGELDQVRAPTLLVWGQDDRATALDIGLLLLRKLPDARLHVFARCGHWAQAEHAEEFNRVTLDFLTADRGAEATPEVR